MIPLANYHRKMPTNQAVTLIYLDSATIRARITVKNSFTVVAVAIKTIISMKNHAQQHVFNNKIELHAASFTVVKEK